MKLNRIKQLRIKNNLKQEDIANALNVDRSTYAGWELGTNTIPLRKLILLCNYYKINIDYILGIIKKKIILLIIILLKMKLLEIT